jgi:hypothetical protein
VSELWVPGQNPKESEQVRLERIAALSLKQGKENGPLDSSKDISEMRKSRKTGSISKTSNFGSSQVNFATSRQQDPFHYWRQNNLPFDYMREEDSARIRLYCKLVYATHPVIASAIDIFAAWPITGMRLEGKDDSLTDFYTDHFFNDLEYEEFGEKLLKEYWIQGEAFPLGQFNELLGVWDDDELIDPNRVNVIPSPFTKEKVRFEMKIPESIAKIINDPDPKTEWEYKQLMQNYPELVRYAKLDEFMPVSSVLMKQIANKVDTFHHRGISILMRAFRSIYQEEMLNSAIDSIASRLYTPLILVKLGASASDLGTSAPWIPDKSDFENFEASLDMALAADFRVLTSHFATDMSSVFGKESMPDFSGDYDRILSRQLQTFGLSETMLTGASQGETYAADGLNRDIVTVKLRRAQKIVRKLYQDRAYIVAEAQEHFDWEMRGGKKYPIMEEILEIDPETGDKKIVERPKLLIPEMKFDVLNLQDENTERQFIEALRASGVAISDHTRLTNVEIDLDTEAELIRQERIDQALQAAEIQRDIYRELRRKGLPIPQNLQDDFEPKVLNADEVNPQVAAEEAPTPNMMIDPATGQQIMAPNSGDYMAAEESGETQDAPPEEPVEMNANQMAQIVPLPRARNRPPESDEQRARMPKASSFVQQDRFVIDSFNIKGDLAPKQNADEYVEEGSYRLINGPQFSKRATLNKDIPLDEQGY